MEYGTRHNTGQDTCGGTWGAVSLVPAVELGVLIRDRRRVLGLSQRTLAERVCARSGRATVTRHEISRYERQTRIPTASILGVLGSVLDIPVVWLRQAAWFASRCRHLAYDQDGCSLSPQPGYLIGGAPNGEILPMITIGANSTANSTANTTADTSTDASAQVSADPR